MSFGMYVEALLIHSANCLQYGHIASECKNERVCSRCGEPGFVLSPNSDELAM